MSGPGFGVPGVGATGPQPPDRAQLRRAAQDFEAVFLSHLLREMRATVPQEPGEAMSGQDLFRGFFDDAIAQEAARRSTRGLGEALFRQLERRLGGAPVDQVHGPTAPGGSVDGD